jgi:4-amino-4-deoxy-L-arabinose transferase-like glycosyltransferase
LITGAALLASPTLGFATAVLLLLSFLRPNERRKPWLQALAISLLVVAPWTVRNALVFERFIPIKSNAANELYQANIVDDDGIFDSVNQLIHPFNRLDSRFQYAKLGEIAYVKDRGEVFRRVMPWRRLLRNVGNRAVAIIVYHPLAKAMDGPIDGPIRHVVYAAPVLVLLASIGVRGPHRRLLRVLGIFCFSYLVPYVVAAFYIRYFLVLTPVYLTILYFGIDQLAERWHSRAASLPVVPRAS